MPSSTVNRMRFLLVSLLLMGNFILPESSLANDKENKALALKLFEQGNTQYNLGHWQEAIVFFKEAYEAHPAPAFLFNLGQSYRQAKNCEQSLFFYKRYLDLEKKPKNLIETEHHILAQKERCRVKKEEEDKKRLEAKITQPIPAPAPIIPTAPRDDKRPKVGLGSNGLFFDLHFGVAKFTLGQELSAPLRPNLQLFVGYTFQKNNVRVHLGSSIGFVPFGYTQPVGENMFERRNSSMFSLLFMSKISYQIHKRFSLGLKAGAGVLAWTGISSSPNIFIEEGLTQNGPLLLASFETGLQIGFQLQPNIELLLTPIAFAYSPRRKTLDSSLGSLTRYQSFLGVGIRF